MPKESILLPKSRWPSTYSASLFIHIANDTRIYYMVPAIRKKMMKRYIEKYNDGCEKKYKGSTKTLKESKIKE